jgi:hypothetical protein
VKERAADTATACKVLIQKSTFPCSSCAYHKLLVGAATGSLNSCHVPQDEATLEVLRDDGAIHPCGLGNAKRL